MLTLQSKGVVHRDLKPQNLLLHHSGNVFPSPSEIQVKIGELCAGIILLYTHLFLLHCLLQVKDGGPLLFLNVFVTFLHLCTQLPRLVVIET